MSKCNHDWEVLVDKVLLSAYEQMRGEEKASLTGWSYRMFEKKSITILKCKKCGRLDKTIKVNPD